MHGSYVPLSDITRFFPGSTFFWANDGSLKITMPDSRFWTLPPGTAATDVVVDVFTGTIQWKKHINVGEMYYGPNPPVQPFVPAPLPPTIQTTHTSPVAPTSPSSYADAVIAMMNDQIETQKKDIEAMKTRMAFQDAQIKQLRTDMETQSAEMYALGQENRELRERGDALEEQNEAVNEQLDDAREELAEVLRDQKKKGKNGLSKGGIVTGPPTTTQISAPDGMVYTVNAGSVNSDQLAARVVRELDRKGGMLRNPW